MAHNVVVIGAGYAGLPAVKRLARQVRKDEVSVTLVSAFPTFVERPRLHQLAVGQPIKQIALADYLRGSRVRLVVASVTNIDLQARHLVTVDERGRQRRVGYQTLIYALGSNIDVTSVPGVAEHCYTLMGSSSALDLHERLTGLAREGGTVAVCGGGLTGIETATEVAEAFPSLKVQLISRGTPGGWLSPKARTYLDETLTQLRIRVVTGVDVDHVEPEALVLADGRHLPFSLSIWAGGFSVPTLARAAGLAVNSHDRALVDATLRSITHPNVYVIGDAAAVAGSWGEQLPMGCRSGGFTGPQVAGIVAARLAGREPKPFRYRYFHECISLGRRHGLVQFFNADESPKNRILTGRKAITYKNMVLNSAKMLFRHTGPLVARRRHLRFVESGTLDSRITGNSTMSNVPS
ncbi:NAD(P)/FAD-dependent oxidoreductase [Rugosimonospora africana]|uniref:Oxidoreductase n=1 Tax=Rugosimonospora africana TaxID=556532 RepID=A0A8J3R182_9ACTN|nr:FAD-dependent oxidoreductase [Rugosimonospora africana]GIH21169.1 oxidoreductase [Rugosimonospora africana]